MRGRELNPNLGPGVVQLEIANQVGDLDSLLSPQPPTSPQLGSWITERNQRKGSLKFEQEVLYRCPSILCVTLTRINTG